MAGKRKKMRGGFKTGFKKVKAPKNSGLLRSEPVKKLCLDEDDNLNEGERANA